MVRKIEELYIVTIMGAGGSGIKKWLVNGKSLADVINWDGSKRPGLSVEKVDMSSGYVKIADFENEDYDG